MGVWSQALSQAGTPRAGIGVGGAGPLLLSFLSVSQPCLQYWPEPGRQQYGLMEVEFVSGTANEDLVSRVFRVQNSSRVSDLRRPRVSGQGCLY